jgi:hypothetical protein
VGCGITTDWDDQIVLESFDDRSSVCQLSTREYRLSEVLNQTIDNYLRFAHRSYLVEGWLLASGIARIPTRYSAGAIVPFQLTFIDQFQNEISVEAELSVDRTAQQEREAARPRRGLYDVGETTELKEAKMGRLSAPADSFCQPWWAKNE